MQTARSLLWRSSASAEDALPAARALVATMASVIAITAFKGRAEK